MDATDRRVVGEEKANIDQLPDPDHLASHEMWLCIMASSRGVFLEIRGGGVPPGTPDPDLIAQPRPQGAFPGFGGGAFHLQSRGNAPWGQGCLFQTKKLSLSTPVFRPGL